MNTDPDRLNLLERLPRRRAPERDLWPGIHARLEPRRRDLLRSFPLLQFALAASLVAGLASVVGISLRGTAPGAGAGGMPAAMASAPYLTADSRAIVEANVSLLKHAERELQQALRKNPDSAALRRLLDNAENRRRALRAML